MTGQMTHFRGEGASRGIAIGPAHVLAAKITVAERRILRHDRAAEVAHLEEGIGAADEQLDQLQRQLADRKGAGADLVQAHRLMLRSPEVAGEARRLILEECCAAEWAVSRALDEIRATFLRIQDPVLSRAGRRLRGRRRTPDPRAARVCPSCARARRCPPARSPWAPTGALRSVPPPGRGRPRDRDRTRRQDVARGDRRARARAALRRRRQGPRRSRALPARSSSSTALAATSSSIPSEEVLRTYRARAEAQRQRDAQLLAEKDLPAVTTDGVGIHLRGQRRVPARRRGGRRVGRRGDRPLPHGVPLPRARGPADGGRAIPGRRSRC